MPTVLIQPKAINGELFWMIDTAPFEMLSEAIMWCMQHGFRPKVDDKVIWG